MVDLIYRLKEEHRRLAIDFQRISAGIPSREFKASIPGIHDRLFSHLERENEKFYPYAEGAAESHETLAAVASFRKINDVLPGLKKVFADFASCRERFNVPVKEVHNHILKLLIYRFKREEELLFSQLLPQDANMKVGW